MPSKAWTNQSVHVSCRRWLAGLPAVIKLTVPLLLSSHAARSGTWNALAVPASSWECSWAVTYTGYRVQVRTMHVLDHHTILKFHAWWANILPMTRQSMLMPQRCFPIANKACNRVSTDKRRKISSISATFQVSWCFCIFTLLNPLFRLTLQHLKAKKVSFVYKGKNISSLSHTTLQIK